MKKIVGAALGTCVHVGGLHHFFMIAEKAGYRTLSLGPAVSIERIMDAVKRERPDMLAISYRLTPEVAAILFEDLGRAMKENGLERIRLVFGGTPPVAKEARRSGIFERAFDGSESMDEISSFLEGTIARGGAESHAQDLVGRIAQSYPYPVIRHHFGRPTMEETLEGIRQISLAGVLDVISIGPDQNAQEHFFRQEEMDRSQTGAGGVPVRKKEDMAALYEASRCGNFPLMRCYAGTRDLLKWAEMSVETINNAWGAIPLCWYSVMDGRSDRSLEQAIAENQSVMKWYSGKGIPVEVNESHQWSLRDAHDSLAVTMAFLAAYNAKKMGVRNYVSQFMFNTPPGTEPLMDIAKMLAKLEMITSLEDDNFSVYREVRAGIAHFSPVPAIAKGQLAASALVSLAMRPHILHVVSYSEGDHATLPSELIESCQIVHGVLRNCLGGLPDLTADPRVKERKDHLVRQAGRLLTGIDILGAGSDDPYADPGVIASAIRRGILDAPHFTGNPHLNGSIITGLVSGGWEAMDPVTGKPLEESERIMQILKENELG